MAHVTGIQIGVYGVGVTTHNYAVKKIDLDYFDEDEGWNVLKPLSSGQRGVFHR